MAGETGAHLSSTLHGYGAPFLVISVLTELVECEKLTKEVFYWWGGGGLQSRTCDSKVQTSTFSDSGGTLQLSAHDKVGQNGCGVGCRTPASG
jgi:hypothetical protein